MMWNFLLVSAILCNFFLFACHGANSTEAPVDDEPSPEEQFRMLFQEVDTDSDMGISRAEALAFWQEKVKSMEPGELKKRLDKYNATSLDVAVDRGFKLVDKDASGKVSPEELKIYLTSD